MASKKPKPAADEQEKLPVPAAKGEVGVSMAAMFDADSGSGMESADADSFAIPFLGVLQKSSPQVDENEGVYIEGAKAGMFFENVSRRMYDGKEGILIIPCHFRRVFVRWGPRAGEGAGYKGEIAPEVVAEMRRKNELIEDGPRLFFPREGQPFDPKKNDRLSDTRNHYVLLYDADTGECTPCVLSLTSTQIKKSKSLMALLGNQRIAGKTPPTFANIIRATTIPEANDEGTWHGVMFKFERYVDNMDVYHAAKSFYTQVKRGNAEVKYEAPDAGAARDDDVGF